MDKIEGFNEPNPKMKKLNLVSSLKSNTSIKDIFVVKFKKPVTQYKKGYMFELRLGDSSGEIMMKYWGGTNKELVEDLFNSIKKDDVVYINGTVGEYQGILDISVDSSHTITVCPKGTYDQSDFIPSTNKDMDKMFSELVDTIKSIKEPTLSRVLDYFFKNDQFIENFKEAPAAMYKHHGWVGGLMEHILDMINIAETVIKVHPELNRDLLITGIIMHDLGKIEELEVTTNIKTSKEGMLKGHMALVLEELTKALIELKIPKNDEIVIKLTHMILSHHGKLEYGSPKLPAFPEAMALYQIDELNSKLRNMISTKQNAVTEDDYIYTKDFGNVYLK